MSRGVVRAMREGRGWFERGRTSARSTTSPCNSHRAFRLRLALQCPYAALSRRQQPNGRGRPPLRTHAGWQSRLLQPTVNPLGCQALTPAQWQKRIHMHHRGLRT